VFSVDIIYAPTACVTALAIPAVWQAAHVAESGGLSTMGVAMASKCRMPAVAVKKALILCTKYGIDLVARRDGRGRVLAVSVPYYDQSKGIHGYCIRRRGTTIEADRLGEKPAPCALSRTDRRRLLGLWQAVQGLNRRASSRRGPHRMDICT